MLNLHASGKVQLTSPLPSDEDLSQDVCHCLLEARMGQSFQVCTLYQFTLSINFLLASVREKKPTQKYEFIIFIKPPKLLNIGMVILNLFIFM